jgi:2-polyprenyl-3-methyl-5-hydroxy-6-metoxy-1,4-benzoquinol methylase
MIDENSNVLDIGCSKGDFGEALIKLKTCIVDGVEPDSDDAKIASKKLSTVIKSTVEEILSTKQIHKKYDYIVFLDVIEHLYDPVITLKSLKRYLTKHGRIIFSIPNMAHISVRIMLLNGKFEYGQTGLLDNTHLHYYTDKEIHRVFADSGYIIEKLKGVIVDYSDEVLSEELKKIGIENSVKDLRKVLRDNSGEVYQYVGSAKPIEKKTNLSPREFTSPDAKGTVSLYYQTKIAELKEAIQNLKEKLGKRERELESIKNSKSWRLIQAHRRYLARVKNDEKKN